MSFVSSILGEPFRPAPPRAVHEDLRDLSKPYKLLAACLGVCSLAPIWAGEYFPTQNGPWYVLVSQMLRQWNNPEFNYGEFYDLHWHPIPYLIHYVLVWALSWLAPILTAHKIALSLYVLVLPLSCFYYLYATRSEHPWLGIIGYLLIYNYCFLRGYQNYAWGIAMVLFALGHWQRHHGHWTAGRLAIQTWLMLLVYFCHVVAFASLGLALLVELGFDRGRWRQNFLALLLVSAPALACLAEYVVINATSNVWLDANDVEWLKPHAAAEMLVRKLLYGYSTTAYYAALVAIVPLTVLVVHTASMRLEDYIQGENIDRDDSRRFVLAVVFAVLYFLMPYHFYGWHYVDVRVAPYVVIFAMAAVTGDLAAAWRKPLLAVVSAAALFGFAVDAEHVRRLNRDIHEYLSGVEHVPRNSTMLSVIGKDQPQGLIRPRNKLYEYYAVLRGGGNGGGIGAFNTASPLWYKSYPVADTLPTYDPDEPPESLERYAEVYDCIIFWEAQQELRDQFAAVGFVPKFSHEKGRLHIYHNPQRIKAAAAAPRPVHLSAAADRPYAGPLD